MKRERIIDLPRILDKRGNLSFIEAERHIPFPIVRAYWIYDVPGGQRRGGHAFKTQHEVIIALSGSFDVLLDDGEKKSTYTLNRSYQALYVPNMVWRSMENFSTNALCLVIASTSYDEGDYIRNYKTFRELLISGSLNHEFTSSKHKDKDIETASLFSSVFDCNLIEFPVIKNRAGNITPVHGNDNIPFNIKRLFYIYDIPSGARRGMHAHKHCHEVLIAASGSFEVELDDGINKKTVLLNRPMYGLHIPPGIWATEKEYSSGAICLSLASDVYDQKDYVKTYSDFKNYRRYGN